MELTLGCKPVFGRICLLVVTLNLATAAEPLYTIPYDYARLLFDGQRTNLYLARPGPKVVACRDLSTGNERATVALSLTPTDAAMTPDGRRLFVSEAQMGPEGYLTDQPGRIAEIDLATLTLVREIDYPYSPRALVARDDGILVVGNLDPVNGGNEVRLFNTATLAGAGRLVITTFPFTLDSSQNSIFGYGLGNVFNPNVRVFLTADPLGFGTRRKSPGLDMTSPVHPSPDGRLLISGTSFHQGSPDVASEDMRLIRTPDAGLRLNQVARFEPPNGRTLLICGVDGPVFFRRDTLEPFASAPIGNTLDAAYGGEHVYAVVFQSFDLAEMHRFENPALGMDANQPPVATYSWTPAAPTDRDDVRLDAGATTDDEAPGENLRFRWDFDSDGEFETGLTDQAIVFHRFLAAGVHQVTIEVRDRFGAASLVTNSFTVTPVPDPGEPGGPHTAWEIPLPSTRVVFDPLRPVLYAASLTNQSLVQMDLTTGRIARHWRFDAMISAMAIQPDGRRLYLGLTTNDPAWGGGGGNGWVAVLDLTRGVKERAFAIALNPMDLVATDGGQVVVDGITRFRELHLYDASTGAQRSVKKVEVSSRLALHPAQQVIYAASPDNAVTLKRYWLSPETGLLEGPGNSAHLTAGRVFPMPDGTNLVTGLGALLTASPAPGLVGDMKLVRDLGWGSAALVLPLPDRGMVGLVQGTGMLTNSFVFLRDDWQTEVVRLPIHYQALEVSRYGDRIYSAVVTKTNTVVESRRLPARNVEEDLPPTVTLLSPADGTVVLLGSTLELRAEAGDEDGNVMNLHFFNGDEDLGEAPPWYSQNFQPATRGTYHLSAVATDNLGVASRSAVATVIVNAPPTITLNNPITAETLISPASFILEAVPEDPEGRVVEVEYRYLPHRPEPIQLGVVTTPPYRLEVTNFTGIDGVVQAIVRDNFGASATASGSLRILGPTGDDLRRPWLLEGTHLTVRTNNVRATTQRSEERILANPLLEHSLWWEWTSPLDGVLRISTQGSSFDTQLVVMKGTNVMTFEQAAFDEDGLPSSPTSEAKVPVTTGTQYLIGVASTHESWTGLVTLRLQCDPVGEEPTAPPINDDFANRSPLAGIRVSAEGTNRGATAEAGEPKYGPPGGLWSPHRSVWWTWTAPETAAYRISTADSDFDTVLTLAVGESLETLRLIAANEDDSVGGLTSEILLQASAGRSYQIAVDGFGGHAGGIKLQIAPVGGTTPPGNDSFRDGMVLSGTRTAARGTTFAATLEPGEPMIIVTNRGARTHTVWYSWSAPRDALARLVAKPDASSIRMELKVFAGVSLEALTPLVRGGYEPRGSHFDTIAQWRAIGGQTYQFQLNASQDTHFALGINATIEDELPRLEVIPATAPSAIGLEIASQGLRRLQVQDSRDLVQWRDLHECWLEGMTNLMVHPDPPSAPRFFRAVAY